MGQVGDMKAVKFGKADFFPVWTCRDFFPQCLCAGLEQMNCGCGLGCCSFSLSPGCWQWFHDLSLAEIQLPWFLQGAAEHHVPDCGDCAPGG